MAIAGLPLTEQEQKVLETMAQRIGKTPDELVHDAVKQLIAQYTEKADLAFLGEPRVNVLMLNVAVDQQFPVSK